jgi:hypothetical protein
MRPIAAPVCGCPPSGARIRTRLRVDADDERVLWAVGAQLGGLAGLDLAARCRRGRRPARRPQARFDRGGVVTVGGDDHPDLERPVGAWPAQAAGRSGGAVAGVPDDPVAAGRASWGSLRPGTWVCQPGRRVRGYASRADGYVGMPAGPSGSKSRAAFSIWRPGWHGGGALAQGRVSVCRGAGGSPSSATAWTVATWR